MVSSSSSFLVSPNLSHDEYIRVTPQAAGWDHLSFAARQIRGGGAWDFETHDNELALVVLGRMYQVTSNLGTWMDVGRRPHVFAVMPCTLFLPLESHFTAEAPKM